MEIKEIIKNIPKEKIYYQSALGVLINDDCLNVMQTLPDKSIDLVLTDPPYGIGVDKDMANKAGQQFGKAAAPKKDYGFTDWDVKPVKTYFDNILRVSKNQIIFGGNYFTDNLPPSRCYLVWDKKQMINFQITLQMQSWLGVLLINQ